MEGRSVSLVVLMSVLLDVLLDVPLSILLNFLLNFLPSATVDLLMKHLLAFLQETQNQSMMMDLSRVCRLAED